MAEGVGVEWTQYVSRPEDAQGARAGAVPRGSCGSSWAGRWCSEDRDRGRIATSQGREAGGSITPAHPLDSRRCPGAGPSQVTRLEQALHHGICSVAESDMLQEALKRARPSAQERPLANQISECTRFIERSTHRLAKIDAEREAEVAALEEARSRLARLEAQSKMSPQDVPTSTATGTGSDVIAELEDLEAKLASTERERDEALAAPACKRQAMSRTLMVREGTPPPVPDSMIPAELSSWMDDRHAELFAAISIGDQVRTQRLTSMMAECAERLHQLTTARTS